MTKTNDLVEVVRLGELIFWHEEIIDLIRHRSVHSTCPETTEEFYNLINFKPDFYSLNLINFNYEEIPVISLTHVTEDCDIICRAIGLKPINSEKKEYYSMFFSQAIFYHIEQIIEEVLDNPDAFTQSAISMQMFARRKNVLKV